MPGKSKFVHFTRKQRANILDFFTMFASSFAIFVAVISVLGNTGMKWHYGFLVATVYALTYLLFIFLSKINNIMWEHATGKTFMILSLDVVLSTTVTYLVFLAIYIGVYGKFEKWTILTACCIMFGSYFLVMVSKFLILQLYSHVHRHPDAAGIAKSDENNTLIIGAGWTGGNILTELLNDASLFKPVCFLDDDATKMGKNIEGVPIVGTTRDIAKTVDKYGIRKILFAVVKCSNERRRKILADCVATKCAVRVVEPASMLVEKSGVKPRLKEVRIEDLLGRNPQTFDMSDVREFVRGKRIMVTGGGGSIGSELCRQIAAFGPKMLVILDIYENNAYDIQQELLMRWPKLDLRVEICSIADCDKCRIVFERYRPQLIYHAAAHKHVPLMEHAPEQAIKNNVVGTLNLCRLASEFGVDRFLLVSTDKAVNPTNVMGASKRCCEMIVKYHAQKSPGTVFCAVRFGNVLGSNGSVIPLFKRQIENGGPVTLTHRSIVRYFMTIPEAVSLLLETGYLSKNGEIFVLDMGAPIKILDLARNMIRLSGYAPNKDIDIVFTGLRPGEKLIEELLIAGEDTYKTSNEKIEVCKQIDVDEATFPGKLAELIETANANRPDDVKALLRDLIPTYHAEPAARAN